MKSIRSKFLLLLLSCTLFSSAVIGGAGLISSWRMADRDAKWLMSSVCSELKWETESLIKRIEQSILTISDYAVEQLDDVERFRADKSYVDEYTRKVKRMLLNAAGHTEGALSVYIRYNPEFTDPVSGLFYSRETPQGSFKRLAPTDFSVYDPSDLEHVGWYYIPVVKGKPTWMSPYYNENIGVEIISYVIPMRVKNVTVGVVGMDIDFSAVKEIVDKVSVYQSGYAFLIDANGDIVYHKDYQGGTSLSKIDSGLNSLAANMASANDGNMISYELNGVKKQAVFRSLDNGMKVVVTAPVGEIHAARNALALQILAGTALTVALTALLNFFVTRRMTRPLKELNEAAQKLAQGDMSVTITCRTKDEIGALAESFRKTASQLNHYISSIRGLAYRDPMTGVKSKTAYLEIVDKLERDIKIGRPEFGIVIFDLNGLKEVNDTFGHDFGDLLIIGASKVICSVFKHSPVYRIGGDEFVVILEQSDLKNYGLLLERFQTAVEEYNRNAQTQLKVSVARGVAIFNQETDFSYHDVFKRADSGMYLNKANLKQSGDEKPAKDSPL